MRLFITVIIFFGIGNVLFAQKMHINHHGVHQHQKKHIHSVNSNWKYSFGIGTSSYEGDLTSAAQYFTFKDIAPVNISSQLEAIYVVNEQLFVGGSIGFVGLNAKGRLYGTGSRQEIEYRSRNIEFYANARINIFPYDRKFIGSVKWVPYASLGLGLTTLSPHFQLGREWVDVKDIHGEQVAIPSIAPIIPIGIGVQYRMTNQFDLIIEYHHRLILTDKLEGLSHKDAIDVSQLNSNGQRYYNTYYSQDYLSRAPVLPAQKNIGDSYGVLMIKVQYSLIPANKNINRLNFRRRR